MSPGKLSRPGGRSSKGEFSIRARVAAQIVEDDQRIAAFAHEVFAHGRGRVRSNELESGSSVASSNNHDRIRHGAAGAEIGDYFGHRRTALSDGAIDGDYVFVVLVDDAIEQRSPIPQKTLAPL